MALQEELIAVRLREAESSETLKDLQEDIKSLEKVKLFSRKEIKITYSLSSCYKHYVKI